MADWRSNANGNHSNGNSFLRRFEFQDESSRDNSADERSRSRGPGGRPGGYGGLGGSYASQTNSRLQGPSRLERAYGNRRSRQDNDWSQSRSRSRANGPSSGQVEDILQYIEQHWSFMASEDCIPVKIALQLNDSSSLGLMDQYDQFQETHQQLQNALKVIVNEHHQGFNSSIGTFHKIQAAIHASQQRVRTLKAGLLSAKGSLAGTKPELRAFAQSSQTYDSMLGTIASIEALQAVPDRLEAQISEKRFLGAVDTLQDALKTIRRPEMEDIGALSDLKVYLSNQEHFLTDILIEELHAHLYLKSPYCEQRWAARAQKDHNINTLADDTDQAMALFLESFDASKPMQEDPARNPEADTFYYIHLLLESLHKMNRLDIAVDAIEQRLPIELFRVVERSHTDVEQRHPHAMRSASSRGQKSVDIIEPLADDKKAVLTDLLTTLYAKFEAIAEGHRVLYDVIVALVKRDNLDEPQKLNRSFRELWKLLQSEMRSLLHDHLTSDGDMAGRLRNNADGSASMFKAKARDRTRKLFRLTESDEKSPDLASEREALEDILKASVPGLVSSNMLSAAQNAGSDHATLSDRSATGHKLLVMPSVFNMGVLLTPSLHFLNRLKDIVPAHSGVVSSALTAFLDDFLVNVFHPQLDETLTELVSRCMTDLDAFQVLPSWSEHSAKPIFKGTLRFFEVIEGVCKMLDALPHDQSFSHLVITQMSAYYNRSYTWSKALLQRPVDGKPTMRLAAELSTSGEISRTVHDQLGVTDDTIAAQLATKESEELITLAKSRPINEADLISDDKSLASLCALHTSMKWLAARCTALRFVSPRAVDVGNAPHGQSAKRWTSQVASISEPSTPYLPLDANTVLEFDGVVSSFTELSMLILRTLHVDLRLHILHYAGAALRATYALEQPYNDPDPAILKLSGDLSAYDTQLTKFVLPGQYKFLTTQLHLLASGAMMALLCLTPAMDKYGLARMLLNVTVLQQSLKNVQPDGSLEAAERFYKLGVDGCEKIVASGQREGFKSEDLKTLIRLAWVKERDAAGGSIEDYQRRLT